MQLLSSLLIVFALVSGSVDAKPTAHEHVARHGAATMTSDNCGPDSFFWPTRSACLPQGGPPAGNTPQPPSGLDCPEPWYFHYDHNSCVPRTKPSNPTPPDCKDGFTWFPGLQCCSKHKPPTPSFPVPSGVPKPKKDGQKNNGQGGYPAGGYGYDHSKIKRNFEQSDNSHCQSDYTACPIVVHDVFTGDTECIDTLSDLNSCGGCTSMGKGNDCSQIRGASCQGGVCVVV